MPRFDPTARGRATELRGTVSNVVTATRQFTLNGNVTFNYSGATFSPAGASATSLVAGALVEVHGSLAGAVFTATQIDLEDTEDEAFRGRDNEKTEFEGYVSGFTAHPGTFAVNGRSVQTTASTRFVGDRNWSGSRHVKTLERPLRVKDFVLGDGTTALACDGAPSDCVALALLGFFDEKIDLVVSGINPMPNLGHGATYSDTVTAAMEAVIWDVPGFACSLGTNENHRNTLDYSVAADIARKIVEKTQPRHVQPGMLLNINIPYLPIDQIKGTRVTRQGLRVYRDRLDRRVDPRGRSYYWIGGDAPTGIPEEGTDVGALSG